MPSSGLVSLFVVSAIGTYATACRDRSIAAELDHQALTPQAVLLTGKILVSDSQLGRPIRLEATKSHLFVTDMMSDIPLHVFDPITGRRQARYGRKGEGPGEFMRPDRPFVTDSVVWVFNVRLQRLTGVPQDALGSGGRHDHSAPLTVQLGSEERILQMASVENGTWLGIGFLGHDRFASVAATGERSETLGSMPGGEKIPEQARAQVYQSFLAPMVIDGQVAVAATLAGRLEICNMSGACVFAEVPYPYEPAFELHSGGSGSYMVDLPETRRGYLDLDVTANAIYALFSGRSEEGFGARKAYGRFVHVFAWDGRLIQTWELDREAIALAVSPHENVLYTAIHDPLPAVVEYVIPNR